MEMFAGMNFILRSPVFCQYEDHTPLGVGKD